MRTNWKLAGMWSLAAGMMAAGLMAGGAEAHGPTRQKVEQTVEVKAPVAKVWEIVKNFHDMSWDPLVAKTDGDGGNTLQSLRTITLKSGGTLTEDLEQYDADGFSYSTFLPHNDPKVLPVTNYSSVLTVSAGDGGMTTIEWRAAFYRGDPNNDPPPELSDDAAIKAVTAYLKAGLDGLKTKLDAGG